MKNFFLALVLFGACTASATAEDVYVHGYTRKDGTYVAPYTRSEPNAYKWDNKNYTPSQPAYNKSYYEPSKNYGPNWYSPSNTRYQDNNPYNNNPPPTAPNSNPYPNLFQSR